MFLGILIAGFAACYAIALALEVSRLVFRGGVRGSVVVGVAGAGWIAHSAFLGARAMLGSGAPLSSNRDWLLLAAWVLVVVYFYLAYYHPNTSFGVFLLPLVLGLIGAAAFWADPRPFAREPASKVWGMLHGFSLIAATVSVLVAFAAGMVYLGQARRLKRKLPPIQGLRLPSLEWLQETNSRALVISLLTLGIGVSSGVVLNLINSSNRGRILPWNDPLVLGTLAMFLWLLTHLVISALYRPIRHGRRVAYLTIASFLFLVLALALVLFQKTEHGGMRNARSAQAVTWPVGGRLT